VAIHEPVFVRVQLVNPTSQVIDVDLGEDRVANFVVVVTTPQGKEIQCSTPHGSGSPGVVHLEPGEDIYAQMLVLNEWFKFDELGTYNVSIRLASPVRTRTGELPTEAFSTSLTITAKDPRKLAAICEGLLERIKRADSYDGTTEAALALSYVEDPIAVPYLKKALKFPMVTDIVTIGLKRINDSDPM